jgi:hypothetical protein
MKITIPIILSSLLFISGCAAPGPVKEKAASILQGRCFEWFTGYAYQHDAAIYNLVLAYTEDSAGYSCGNARVDEVSDDFFGDKNLTGWPRAEAVAIARCEGPSRPRYNIKIEKPGQEIKTPCKIFSRNNDIVWGKNEKPGFQ